MARRAARMTGSTSVGSIMRRTSACAAHACASVLSATSARSAAARASARTLSSETPGSSNRRWLILTYVFASPTHARA